MLWSVRNGKWLIYIIVTINIDTPHTAVCFITAWCTVRIGWCVCVCVREREREKERVKGSQSLDC